MPADEGRQGRKRPEYDFSVPAQDMPYLRRTVARGDGGREGRRSQGGFLALAGLVCVGIEASLYYWELGFGSLTKSGASGQSGSAWAYLPVGFGVLLLIAGLVLTILDRRAA
jgi:hypothetical protein